MKFLAARDVTINGVPFKEGAEVEVHLVEIEISEAILSMPVSAYLTGLHVTRQGTIKGTMKNMWVWMEMVYGYTPMLSRYAPGMVELARDRRRRV